MNQRSIPERLRKALVLTVMTLVGIGLQAHAFEKATRREQEKTSTKQVKSYSCPMHPEVKSTKPGKCPKCKMDLRLERAVSSTAITDDQNLLAANTASDAPRYARRMVIPEVEVLDQNGNALHFYSDLIKGKTVAINFIFTNCTTICPPLAATFARVQKEIGD